MARTTKNGFALVGILVAAAVFSTTVYFFMQSMADLVRSDEKNKDKIAAEVYASELLEFFVAHKPVRLRANLSTNPVNAALGAYKFCAHINLLDRAGNKVLNRDPLADIPQPSILNDDTGVNGNAVNRFYMVNIINLATLVKRDVCDRDFADPTVILGADERYMVTVGVSWKRPGSNDVEREVVSAMVPQS